MLFADDMAIVTETEQALQDNLEKLNDTLVRWDMKVNSAKTKVMKIGRCNVVIKGERVEQVEEFRYLGVMLGSDG